MTTIKLVLQGRKMRSDGTCPVYLRTTSNRRSRYVSTGVRVKPAEWNESRQRVRKTHPTYSALNARLADMVAEATKAVAEGSSAEGVQLRVTGGGGSLLAFLDQVIQEQTELRKHWTTQRFKVLRSKVRACFGSAVDFRDIDPAGLGKFARFMESEYGNGPSTIRKDLYYLKRLYRRAIKEGLVSPSADPFARFDMPKATRPERRKLALSEIRLLEAVHVAGRDELVRDAFVAGFYLGGMRFGDICTLKVGDLAFGRCAYRMNKTGRFVSLPIPAPVLPLLARYTHEREPGDFVFPFLRPGDDSNEARLRRRISSRNTTANQSIKRVAKVAGIPRPESVTMHAARHSFADHARKRSGDLYGISLSLGHRDLQTTQTYLSSLDEDAVDAVAREVWGG